MFLPGLFSLMDAILDVDMDQVVKQLPVSDQLKLALVKGEGELADYLKIVAAYEQGRWKTDRALGPLGDAMGLTFERYMEAIGWADAITGIS